MLISLKDVTHIYEQQPPVTALNKINLEISRESFIGLVGATGSGKSTLVQLLNGLLKPTEGQVVIAGIDLSDDKSDLKKIRQQVGLVFQYPEHQLFEENIYREVAFGPKNLGFAEEEVNQRVEKALDLVGLKFDNDKERSPFNLSGGQQRKVALAGVLAMQPKVLILDEPFAGLDPAGREQITQLLKKLHQEQKITVILISHRMEEIARLADRVVVLKNGEIALQGGPREVFAQREKLLELSLDIPEITSILYQLKEKGLDVRTDIFSVSQAAEEIKEKLRSSSSC